MIRKAKLAEAERSAAEKIWKRDLQIEWFAQMLHITKEDMEKQHAQEVMQLQCAMNSMRRELEERYGSKPDR